LVEEHNGILTIPMYTTEVKQQEFVEENKRYNLVWASRFQSRETPDRNITLHAKVDNKLRTYKMNGSILGVHLHYKEI